MTFTLTKKKDHLISHVLGGESLVAFPNVKGLFKRENILIERSVPHKRGMNRPLSRVLVAVGLTMWTYMEGPQ